MDFKTTLGLLVLVLIVALVWFFAPATQPDAETDDQATPESEYVFDPQPVRDDVVRVVVERPDHPRLVFERTDEQPQRPGMTEWTMVEPLAADVQAHHVRSLVSTLVNLRSRTRVPLSELPPGEAGLDPPAATVTLVDKQDREHTLQVGGKAVMSSDTYVRVPSADVIQVAEHDLPTLVKKDVSEYRSTNLVRLKPDEVTRLRIEHAGRTYDLSRGDDDEWIINEPLRAYAERDKVRGLIGKINGLRVEEFVDDAPTSLGRYGLGAPFVSVEVTSASKRELPADPAETQPVEPQYETVTETHQLLFGGLAGFGEEQRYGKLAAQPSVVAVSKTTLEELLPNLDELRDPRVTRFNKADVSELTLDISGASVTLKRVDGRWQSTDDWGALESEAVLGLLEALEDLRAISYIDEPDDPASYGIEQPRAVLRIVAAGAASLTLRIGGLTPSGRNAYVQRNDEPTVIVTSAAQAERLALSPLALRSRAVFDFPVERLRSVDVEREQPRYVLTRDDENQWRLGAPPGAPVDSDAVRNLTADLSRLRAAQIVDRENYEQYGLAEPTVTLRFEVEPQPPADTQPTVVEPLAPLEHTLYVGRADNVAYARVDDQDFVFQLDDTVYRTLTAELIDTRLFSFKPERVVGVTVVGPEGELELARDGSDWKYAPEPYLALDQEQVRGLVQELAQLRAQRYLAYRDADLAAAGLQNPPASVTIKLADGSEVVLALAAEQPDKLWRVAGLPTERRVFRLARDECAQLLRGVESYIQAEDQPR